jgi:hypothetical protein
MTTKKEPGKEPREASKDEGLTRRTAIKRIAAGLAGIGIVVVAGSICQEQPKRADEMGVPPYGDSAKLPYRDKAPN